MRKMSHSSKQKYSVGLFKVELSFVNKNKTKTLDEKNKVSWWLDKNNMKTNNSGI